MGVLFYTISLNARTADNRDPAQPPSPCFLLPFLPLNRAELVSNILDNNVYNAKKQVDEQTPFAPLPLHFTCFPRSHRSSCYLIRNPFVSPPPSNRCPLRSPTSLSDFPSPTPSFSLPTPTIPSFHFHHAQLHSEIHFILFRFCLGFAHTCSLIRSFSLSLAPSLAFSLDMFSLCFTHSVCAGQETTTQIS